MNEVLKVNFDNQTVSARDLHELLNIGTKFTTWFERMKDYGFSEGEEFFPKLGKTSELGGRPQMDYEITVDMAKQICMIQRTPEGKACRQYLA
jgi:anti-repressor protein